MTTSTRHTFLQLLKASDSALTEGLQAVSVQIRAVLLSAANADGTIPLLRWSALEQKIGDLILYFFLSRQGRAYHLAFNGALVGASPYLRLLWAATEKAVQQAVEEQSAILKAKLTPEQARQTEHAQINPFQAFDLLGANAALFQNFLPLYGDVFGNGRTLEDRVHRVAGETRQKVAALLREQLSQQKNAIAIAEAVTLLLDGQSESGKPGIGTTAKADAARLLAGQTIYAHEKTRLMAAALSPFTESVDVVLSPSHREVDDCDDAAAGSPYLLKDAPILPLHGNCLCSYRFHSSPNTQAIVTSLKPDAAVLTVRGPLSPGFADLLLRGRA